jgi:hypothetical protein
MGLPLKGRYDRIKGSQLRVGSANATRQEPDVAEDDLWDVDL